MTTYEVMTFLIENDKLDLLDEKTLEEITQEINEEIENKISDWHFSNLYGKE